MPRLFGTDGVRGIANSELTCEIAFKLGQAATYVLAKGAHKPVILVGRDTRASGEMLEAAMSAGICSMGGTPMLVEVIPTPGIAYLTRHYGADAGVVISASHNTVEYNGIKFFDGSGYKLPDKVEDEIEAIVTGGIPEDFQMPVGSNVGRIIHRYDAKRCYIDFVKSTTNVSLKGLKITLDCAEGANSDIAAAALTELGAQVESHFNTPDGNNINKNCGSTHPEQLCQLVKETSADVGLAFDGDADRLICVDEMGNIVNGDQVMCICANAMKEEGTLKRNTLVTTVMSNIGLDIALKKLGISSEKTKVGDRYVLENMLANGYCIGGEQSGHVIFLDHNTTGDGLITAIQLLSIMAKSHEKLSQLTKIMEVFPQSLCGARVTDKTKHDYDKDPVIMDAIHNLEAKYEGRGRVLIRVSGTEPLVRVMIEGPDQVEMDHDAQDMASLIESRLNK